MRVLAGARGGWGVLGFRNDEFEPLAVLTFVTRDPARKKLAPGAVGAKLGRVEGYMRREAALFRDFARVINAINATAGPARVLDIGANHGLFALFAALRGARVAAVEAQATLASLVKVSALANGVDVEVYHNAVLDVPAVVEICVEINQCVGCTRQFFTKSFLGDGAAVLAPSSGEEPASSRHRAGVASMAWGSTRRFSTNAQ